MWGKGRASDNNGYKAHHNRTPLNSICRIGNKPCLVYLGSHTRPHNSHTEIASREQTEKLPCETCFLELSVPLSPQRGRKNFFSREKDGKSGLSFSKGNDRSVEIGQSRGLADTSGKREWSKDEGREELAFSENTRFRAWQSVLRDEMRFHGVGEDRFRLSSYWRSTFDARRVWNTRLENEREKRSRRFGRGVKSQAGKPGGLPSRLLAPPRHWQSAFRSLPQVSLPSSISQPGHGGISSPTRKWEREVYSDERDLDRRKIGESRFSRFHRRKIFRWFPLRDGKTHRRRCPRFMQNRYVFTRIVVPKRVIDRFRINASLSKSTFPFNR